MSLTKNNSCTLHILIVCNIVELYVTVVCVLKYKMLENAVLIKDEFLIVDTLW